MTLLLAPAMIPIIAAIVSAVAAIAGGTISAVSTSRANNKNIQSQWDMWNATNEYNTPLQDISRMKEAGLNPNLAFGGTPYHATPMSVGIAQPVNFDFIGQSVNQGLSTYQSMNTHRMDTELKDLDRLIRAVELNWSNRKLQQEYDLTSQELANLKETFNKIQKEISKIDSDISESQERRLLTELERAHKQLNYNYDRALYEKNLPPDLDPNTKLIVGMFSSLIEKLSFGKIGAEEVLGELLGLELPSLQ